MRARIEAAILEELQLQRKVPEVEYPTLSINDASWDSTLIQLRALGFLETGSKKRTVSDTGKYWELTALGDASLVALLAQRRPDPETGAKG